MAGIAHAWPYRHPHAGGTAPDGVADPTRSIWEAQASALANALPPVKRVRLVALELALRTGEGLPEDYILRRAERFAAFINAEPGTYAASDAGGGDDGA